MIKAIARSTKLFSFVVLFSFVFQIVVAHAEHVGSIPCANEMGKADTEKEDKSPSSGDECCGHVAAIFSPLDSEMSWNTPLSASFIDRDDLIPDGPALAIDLPPRLA